jgi:hypothetical protein
MSAAAIIEHRRQLEILITERCALFMGAFGDTPTPRLWTALKALGAGDWTTFARPHIAYQWAKLGEKRLGALTIEQIQAELRRETQ